MQLTKIFFTLLLIIVATSATTNSQLVPGNADSAPIKKIETKTDSLEETFNKKIDSATEILQRIDAGQQLSKSKVFEVRQLIKKLLKKKTKVVSKSVPVVVRDTVVIEKDADAYPYTEKTFAIKIDSSETKKHFFLSRWWNNIFKRKK